MKKLLPILTSILLFLVFIAFPVLALAQKRSGIHIGTKYSAADQAIAGVGPGGWIVVIAGGTGDCEAIQQIISKAEAASVNVVVRGHLNNYLTPPDALGWAATLGSLQANQKFYFMPWNEPNQAGSADWGEPADVAAYTAALQQHLAASGVSGKTALLSPMLNQTWVGGAGDFDNYVNSLKSINSAYFSQFDGIAMNLYDLSEQICGSALCASDPHFNPAKFSELLNIMGASGKPAFGVESGTAGENFYWKQPPAAGSPLYRFTQKFLETAQPQMFALPAYDLAGEVGHTWDLFTPPDVVNLLGSEGGGGTVPASFDQASFQAWLQSLLASGELVSCGNSCGYASSQNPGLCTATGEPVEGLTETSLTECILIDGTGGHASEDSSPIYIAEAVTYASNEDGTQPSGEENRCFDVFWTAQLQVDKNSLQLPFAYYLNEYFLGALDIHRVPPAIIDPGQLALRNALELAGPIHKITPQRVQDRLKNAFLQETIRRIEQSRLEGEAKTAYISEDLSQVFTIGPWDLEEIFYNHNVYKAREEYYACLEDKTSQECHPLIASLDEQTLAVWQLVPFFANEMTEGSITFSAVDMEFDPNPLKTKVPELYRLNKITSFIQDLLVPKSSRSSPGIPPGGGSYGDGDGLWENKEDGSVCYNASQEKDNKESLYLIEQNLTSSDYEAGITLNFKEKVAKMGLWFRVTIDEELQASHRRETFAGVKGYGFMIARGSSGGYKAELWKTMPPDYILDNPDLIDSQSLGDLGGRLNIKIKVRAVADHIQCFVDLNGDNVIDEATELIIDAYDSDFTQGAIGFKVYNPNNSDVCFTNYEFAYANQTAVNYYNDNFDPFAEIKTSLKTQTAKLYEKLVPDKIKTLLASSKVFQPLDNLLAQNSDSCDDPFFMAIEGVTYDGSQLFYGVRFTNNPPESGFECHLYVNSSFWGGCIAPGGSTYLQAGSSSGLVNPVPAPDDGIYTISASGQLDRHSRCGFTNIVSTSCQVTITGGQIVNTSCGEGAPVFPGSCWTPPSIPILPDPEAIYDEKNYTPKICLKESVTNIEGERAVENKCEYRVDPLTGALVPRICTDTYISAINVKNSAPWLETIRMQTLEITSGIFRRWNPQGLYNEKAMNNPFRPIPAKDQVGYAYSHTGGDPRIDTSMLPGPWDLLFSYLGGIVNTQEWLTGGFLNPLTGTSKQYPPEKPPAPPVPSRPPSSPAPGTSPNPSIEPGTSPSPSAYVPVPPPPPTPITPPSDNLGECASPYAYIVNDSNNNNYVYGNYQGGLQRTEENAHSDKPYLATIVEWPDTNFKFVFSQETGANSPYFEFDDKSGVKFYFYAPQTGDDLYNHYGRLTENNRVEVLQNNNEKVVVQWEYWITNSSGEKLNHAVEFYSFYPCGLVIREMKFLETINPQAYAKEPIMISLLNPVSSRWYDHLLKEEDWYRSLTIMDAYSDNKREFYAKPLPNQLDGSETREEGETLSNLALSQGKITKIHTQKGDVFIVFGDKSGLTDENLLDVGKSSGHACFNSSVIGWTNNQWEKCTQDNFAVYPNETPLLKITHEPKNNLGGQHNFTLMGVGSLSEEQLKNLAKNWLEQNSFFE